jgi:hypothetical protein
MSDDAFHFLQSWVIENINATSYEEQEHLADDCVWEANTRGITEAALVEAAGGDLNAYMLAKLNRTVDRGRVSRLINQASVRRYVVF